MAATDLITIAEAKQELNAIDVEVDDTLLSYYISALSELIDAKCGPVVRRTITDELHMTPATATIRLRHYPVAAISSLVEYDTNGVATTLTADTPTSKHVNGFQWNSSLKFPREIERRSSGARYVFPQGGQALVTYAAGRVATTADVPFLFRQAIRVALSKHWSDQQGSGTMTFGGGEAFGAPVPIILPRNVEAILAAELLPTGIA